MEQRNETIIASYLRQLLLAGPALLRCAGHRFDHLQGGLQGDTLAQRHRHSIVEASSTRLVGKQDLLGEEPIECLRVAHALQTVHCLSLLLERLLLEPAMYMARDCGT